MGISISKKSYLNLPGQVLATAVVMLGMGYNVLSGTVVNALMASYWAQHAHPLPWRYAPALLILRITLIAGAVWMMVFIWHNEELRGCDVLCASIVLVMVVAWWMIFAHKEPSQLWAWLQKKFIRFPTV